MTSNEDLPDVALKKVKLEAQTVDLKKTNVCYFCQKENRYNKINRNKEALLSAQISEIDFLNVSEIKSCDSNSDLKSSKYSSQNLYYHKSCYFLNKKKLNYKYTKKENTHEDVVKTAYNCLYDHIENEIIANEKIIDRRDLFSKLVSFVPDDVYVKIKKSLLSNFNYNLEKKFGNELVFKTIENSCYIFPACLSFDKLLKIVVSRQENEIENVAKRIRDDVKQIDKGEISWPPSPHELHYDSRTIPDSLKEFLKYLLPGESNKRSRSAWSLAQDIIYSISKGQLLTPKHVLLPMMIKSLTGNIEIIRVLNRLGHCCSYTTLLELDTALCMVKSQSINQNHVVIPSGIQPGVQVILAFDNIDRQEETLSGAGTSHRVNGIIIQKPVSSCYPKTSTSSKPKKRKRTIEKQENQLAQYSGKRVNPPNIKTQTKSVECYDNFEDAKLKNIIWVICRYFNMTQQSVPSWTGFNIMARNGTCAVRDNIAYLPTINSPATNNATVREVLRQSTIIRNSLDIKNVVVVLDQAIYSRAKEIVWAHPNEFEGIFLFMGGFHIICNLLSMIGKLFGGAGLADLAVESGIVALGSLDHVLSGKQYNRGVRLHKCVYEALMRIAWKKFELEYCKKTEETAEILQCAEILIKNTTTDLSQASVASLFTNKDIKGILKMFCSFLEKLKKENGQLSAFWMMYIELVEILLGLIRANREGNWALYLYCMEQMIPWCFSLNKTNYARYLSIHFAELSNLKETAPDLHDAFSSGEFSVQLGSKNPFAKLPVDQVLEETVNRDTQTSGGTKGFSLKPEAVSKYYLTSEFRASAVGKMREIVSDVNSDTIHHHDLGKSRILKDEEHVESVVELLDKEWINPFDSFPMKITQLSSGREVSDEVQTNLLEMKEKGTSAYEDFKRNRLEQSIGFFDPIKRTPNLDFKECNSKNKPPKNLTVVGSDSHIFGKMILIAENRQLDLEEIFQYPLGPLPWSLANHDGSLKKTNKAVLAKFLEGKTERQAECSVSSATIIDGMALLHKINGDGHTFDEISKIILSHILQTTSTRIDVVFDDYRSESIKSSERNKRGDKEGLRFQNFKGGQKINAWKKLLLCGDNKKTLCKFLAESWTTSERRCLLGDKILFVTRGKECIKITQTDSTVIPELYSTHEEADTRMMVHIKHASSKHKTIICIADDTDVLVICIYAAQFIDETCNILVKRGRKHQSRFINVRDIISKIGNNVANSLISLHAFTGCDSVSAFAGRGKLKALSLLSSSSEFQDTFSHIGSDWTLSSDCFKSIERFVTQLYCKGTEINSVNALRNHIFRVKQGAVRSDELPPCKNSLLQHSLRANYQAAVWRRCLRTCPEVPSPDNHGWEIKNKEIKIIWMTCLPAPAAVMELLSCKCSISCTLPRCSCLANGLKCSTSCKSQECDNMFKYEEEEEIFDRGGMNSDSEDDDM